MNLLLAKLILTPLAILAAILVGRRWGDTFGGWLAGLPLTSAPVAIFLAIEQGPAFAAASSAGSMAGVASQASFCLGYAALARVGWPIGFIAGGIGYTGVGIVLNKIAPPPLVLMVVSGAMLASARWFIPRAAQSYPSSKSPGWEIPARIALVTAIVFGVTSFASLLGPRASGVTASFPWIGGALAVFAHRAHGAEAGLAVLRGLATALYGFLTFFAVLGSCLTLIPATAAFAAATAGALAVQFVTLKFIRSDARP